MTADPLQHGQENDPGESLIHIIYASAASKAFEEQELLTLLRRSKKKNAARGVTGMLLYADGCFFQVLEGEESAVRSVYEIVAEDPRHTQIIKIIEEPIAARSFGDWGMSFTAMTARDLSAIPGFSGIIEGGHALLELSKGRARGLVGAFIDGRWRSNLAA